MFYVLIKLQVILTQPARIIIVIMVSVYLLLSIPWLVSVFVVGLVITLLDAHIHTHETHLHTRPHNTTLLHTIDTQAYISHKMQTHTHTQTQTHTHTDRQTNP